MAEIKTLRDYIGAGCPDGYFFRSSVPIRNDLVFEYAYLGSHQDPFWRDCFVVKPIGGNPNHEQKNVSLFLKHHLNDLVSSNSSQKDSS